MKYLLWCFFFVVFAKSNLFAQIQKKVNQPASKIENNAAMPQSKSLGSATLENVFLHPPLRARPLVYWFWMGSNFSKTGITKDLEAMKEMGIAGGIIVNLSSAVEESHVPTLNNPFPDQTYRSTAYWEAMRHAAAEAKRLGLEIGMHNTVGYSATGGPWISEDKGMKKLVWRKAIIAGGTTNVVLAKPDPVIDSLSWGRRKFPRVSSTWYKDIAYLAKPLADTDLYTTCLNFTENFDTTGNLIKPLPAGNWIVYRIGYAPTMVTPHPVPDELIGKTLEVDKMSVPYSTFHWNTVLDPFKKYLKPYLGNSFKYMHVDSYEAHDQNWTENFQQQFIQLKGYDPLPWLLTFTPTVTDHKKGVKIQPRNSTEQTERFEWDYKDVINRLYYNNGWDVAKKMIHEANLQFSWEPYTGPFETSEGAAMADFPMGEFWTHGRSGIGSEVTAAARAAGKPIIGAEAFTSQPQNSKWTDDPAFLKPSGDAGFASGANRFILHQWVHQPFDDRYQPGMDMGWWGTHFGRNQTWFKPGKAFIDYLSRCQALLQYGEQVADVLYLDKLDGYGDLISIKDFLTHPPTIVSGKVVLASGRSYQYLVYPSKGKMLPEVATQIKQLLTAGATIVAAKPMSSPSLQNFPACDSIVQNLAREMWGSNTYPKIGKGFLFNSVNELQESRTAAFSLQPAFTIESEDSKFIPKVVYRRKGNTHLFFIVNTSNQPQQFTASFNVKGLQPELWQAEDASITTAPVWEEKAGRTSVWLNLKSQQTLFVVFKEKTVIKDHVTKVNSDNLASLQVGVNSKKQTKMFTENASTISVTYASGKANKFNTQPALATLLNSGWNVAFHPKLNTPFTIKMDTLVDFSKHRDDKVKYFAGTATYTCNLNIASKDVNTNKKWILDLGTVNDIVEVTVNHKKVGTLWYPPFTIDVSLYMQSGSNEIQIEVTNNWVNRLIGDEHEPADFEWGSDRGDRGHAMKAYPDWFIKNQPRPSQGRKSFSIWYYNRKNSPLQPAGLVGPVVLKQMQEIPL